MYIEKEYSFINFEKLLNYVKKFITFDNGCAGGSFEFNSLNGFYEYNFSKCKITILLSSSICDCKTNINKPLATCKHWDEITPEINLVFTKTEFLKRTKNINNKQLTLNF